jgi:2-C-methyl-D-erythritol 4-phosphate cytidylyltransferase
MKKYAIIVAGGSGSRMNTAVPKQFLTLDGKPVLLHSIEAFISADAGINIILVLPAEQLENWEQIKQESQLNIPHQVCAGGETRFHSVKNGLSMIKEAAVVAVHDGVRPFAGRETIERCFRIAEEKGNAIPAVPLTDSIRISEAGKSRAADRSKFVSVQTPQCFRLEVLQKAYQQEYRESFTDDASVVETAGFEIFLTEGNPENIKITTPSDLAIAEVLAKRISRL